MGVANRSAHRETRVDDLNCQPTLPASRPEPGARGRARWVL